MLPEFKVEDAPNGTITSIELCTDETAGKLNAMNQTQEAKIVKGIGDAPTEATELNVWVPTMKWTRHVLPKCKKK